MFTDLTHVPEKKNRYGDYFPDVRFDGHYAGDKIARRLQPGCNQKEEETPLGESSPWVILAPDVPRLKAGGVEEISAEERQKFSDLVAGEGEKLVLQRILKLGEIRDAIKAEIQDDSQSERRSMRGWKFDVSSDRVALREVKVIDIGDNGERGFLGICSISGSIGMTFVGAREKKLQFFSEAAFVLENVKDLQLISICATGQPCLHAGASFVIPGQNRRLIVLEKKQPEKDEVGSGGTSMQVFEKRVKKWIKALETQPVTGFSFE